MLVSLTCKLFVVFYRWYNTSTAVFVVVGCSADGGRNAVVFLGPPLVACSVPHAGGALLCVSFILGLNGASSLALIISAGGV